MSRSVIDEIKERLDIVEVIGGYMPLQKAGRNYKGLCPFHNEKTPSFHVFTDTGTWHCFGACGTGGDVIRFVEKKENLDFKDTLRLLAARAGVELDQHRDPQALSQLNHLREINALAATFFHHQLLHEAAGAPARAYLERRQLNAETIESFQVGFVPEGWDHLIRYMSERDYSLDDLETAGLIVRRDDGGGYDRFRNRVIIPIRDSQGRVIGFGGRILADEEPKYLNTPQTPLFDKSDVVFALDAAKRAIRREDQAVLVEGYMDVISAHQRGFKNVVAAMGTAITPQQLTRLSRYSRNFVFALDADAAGIKATLRSLHTVRETLAQPAVPVPTARGKIRYESRLNAVISVAAMPAGQDPDDVLRQDPDLWARLIEESVPLVEYYFAQAARESDLSTAHGKSQLVEQLLPTISEIDDAIERRHYVGRLAALAGVTEREIDQELERYARNAAKARRQHPAPAKPAASTAGPSSSPAATSTTDEEPSLWGDDVETASPPPQSANTAQQHMLENHILTYLLAQPELLQWADNELAELRFDPISTDDFDFAPNRAIFDAQQEFLYSDAASVTDFLEDLDAALQAHFSRLWSSVKGFEEIREEQRRKDIVDSALRLRRRNLQQQCRQLEQLIRSTDPTEANPAEIGMQLVQTTREQKRIEQALFARSHSGRKANGK